MSKLILEKLTENQLETLRSPADFRSAFLVSAYSCRSSFLLRVATLVYSPNHPSSHGHCREARQWRLLHACRPRHKGERHCIDAGHHPARHGESADTAIESALRIEPFVHTLDHFSDLLPKAHLRKVLPRGDVDSRLIHDASSCKHSQNTLGRKHRKGGCTSRCLQDDDFHPKGLI